MVLKFIYQASMNFLLQDILSIDIWKTSIREFSFPLLSDLSLVSTRLRKPFQDISDHVYLKPRVAMHAVFLP